MPMPTVNPLLYKPFEPPSPNRHQRFRRMLTLQKAVIELVCYPKSPTQSASICGKLQALNLHHWLALLEVPSELMKVVQTKIGAMMKAHHRTCLRDGRTKAKLEKQSDAAVFSYLRNPPPKKLSSLLDGEDVLTHPWDVQASLMRFWQGIETWTDHQKRCAFEALEDRYSMMLPRVEVAATLEPRHLLAAAKYFFSWPRCMDPSRDEGFSRAYMAAVP